VGVLGWGWVARGRGRGGLKVDVIWVVAHPDAGWQSYRRSGRLPQQRRPYSPLRSSNFKLAAEISPIIGNLLYTQLHIIYRHISCFIPNFCTDHMWAGFAVGVCGKGSFAYGGGSGLYALSHPRIDMVGDTDADSYPIPVKGILVLTCSFGLPTSYRLGSPVVDSRPRRTTR
jgi:hypothetical protein